MAIRKVHNIPTISKMLASCKRHGMPNGFDAKPGWVDDPIDARGLLSLSVEETLVARQRHFFFFVNTKTAHNILWLELGTPDDMSRMAVTSRILLADSPSSEHVAGAIELEKSYHMLIKRGGCPGLDPANYFDVKATANLFHMLAANCLPFHMAVSLFNTLCETGSLLTHRGLKRILTIRLLEENKDEAARELVAEDLIMDELKNQDRDLSTPNLTNYLNEIRRVAFPGELRWSVEGVNQRIHAGRFTPRSPDMKN